MLAENSINDSIEENFLVKTFFWMFLGLLGTAISSWYSYSTGLLDKIIINKFLELLLLGEVIVVLLFSFLFKKLPATMVAILYFAYAFLNGITFSVIYYAFDLGSILYVFLATSLLFGGLAYYGYKTEKDLSNWRTVLTGTLLVGILVSIVNMFLRRAFIDIIIDWVILFIVFGFTVYDMNKIRQLQDIDTLDQNKLHVYGAMQLYLDFINIFLRILSLFGKRRK